MHYDLEQLLKENGCSPEFIEDAMRYSKLFKGDIDKFMDDVEEILMSEEEFDENGIDDDDESFDDENLDDDDDPIYHSNYDYEGNDDDIYFEDEDGEEPFEEDEEEE